MASRFRVEWTDAATSDLAEIIKYIARDSAANATKTYRRIRQRARTLKTFPGRGHIVPELANLEILSYRELSVPPYRIIYRMDNQNVFVHAVFDGRRDLRRLLAERLLRLKS